MRGMKMHGAGSTAKRTEPCDTIRIGHTLTRSDSQSPQCLGNGHERLPAEVGVPRIPGLGEISGVRFPDSPYPAVNVASVPQRSPLRYPGGKTWLIPHVEAWLSRHDHPHGWLLEPFCGGGIVSLSAVMEGWVRQCVMTEIDRDVAAFWHAVLRHGTDLSRMVKQFRVSRDEVESLSRALPRGVLERGFRTLVLNRTRRGGILAPGAAFAKNGENGKGLASRWYPQTIADRIEAISAHADRIRFMEGDGMDLLEVMLGRGDRSVAVFADPPYTAGGKRAGRRLYAHHAIDHGRLFATLDDSAVEFMLTYDEAPEIVDLIRKHGFHAVRVLMKNGHHNRVPELVITRTPIFA